MRKIVLIDFHGTLCYKSYSETIKQVLDEIHPDNFVNNSDIRNILDGTYFWDTPSVEHTHLNRDKKWWEVMLKKIQNAYTELGYGTDSYKMAMKFKEYYTTPEMYTIYEDSVEGLKAMREMGCRVYIVSNHVPELRKIVKEMPIGKYVNRVYTSGRIGYEKPNKKLYDYVLDECALNRKCVMIGDNVLADVQGAEKAGIPAILIRNTGLKSNVEYFANDMSEAVELVKEILDIKESLWRKIRKWW